MNINFDNLTCYCFYFLRDNVSAISARFADFLFHSTLANCIPEL